MILFFSFLGGMIVGQWFFIFILWRWCIRLDVHQGWAEDEICQLKHEKEHPVHKPQYSPMFSNQSWF